MQQRLDVGLAGQAEMVAHPPLVVPPLVPALDLSTPAPPPTQTQPSPSSGESGKRMTRPRPSAASHIPPLRTPDGRGSLELELLVSTTEARVEVDDDIETVPQLLPPTATGAGPLESADDAEASVTPSEVEGDQIFDSAMRLRLGPGPMSLLQGDDAWEGETAPTRPRNGSGRGRSVPQRKSGKRGS